MVTNTQASEGEGGGDESCPRVKKVMIWTELQASARQVTQIGTSACGATAIINVLVSVRLLPYFCEDFPILALACIKSPPCDLYVMIMFKIKLMI